MEKKTKPMNMSLLDDPASLRAHVLRVLHTHCCDEALFPAHLCRGILSSSVLMLLGMKALENGHAPEVCVILNKRSQLVPQPGDLCCPGGTVEKTLDPYLARLLMLPGSPLVRWPHWKEFRRREPQTARLVSLLFAAGLRESWEEMRLNPLLTRFLGPLPAQKLLLFKRIIHPMVAWVHKQKRFTLSWEVERLVYIPLRSLLNSERYVRYRLYVPEHLERKFHGKSNDYPCFVHLEGQEKELLWGVTYNILTYFLEKVFGFVPPSMDRVPVVPGALDACYMNGRS